MFAPKQVVSITCWRMALNKGFRKNLHCLSDYEMKVTHKMKRIRMGQHWLGTDYGNRLQQISSFILRLQKPFHIHKSLLVFGTSTDQTQNKRPKKSRKKRSVLFMVRKVFNVNQQRCFSLPLFVRNKTLYGMPCLFRPLTLEKKKKKGFWIKSLPYILWW